MKKVLAWVLLLTLVLGAFAGCKNQPAEVTEPSIKSAGAADAIEYLKGFYTDSGKKTPVDYTRFGIVRVGGTAFNVVWTVDVSEDLVKVVANDDGTVTIDINEECEADTEYTLTATVTDAQGNTASHSWTYILPEGVDMVELVKTAYALQPGESLPYESRLIGKIVSIDAVWSDDYQNVTVTIAVEGAEDMPIKCYRMKANDSTLEAAKNLLVGNIITVSGILKNYEGTIEFDAGCILEKVEKGDAIEAPTDPIEIVKAAYALPQNAALPYAAVLTGTVTAIDNPYDPQYGNICVIITIEGAEAYPILCYRLKGTDVEKIAIGDLITVNGIIKNYKGTIEYDAGCVMTNRVSGGGVAQGPSSDPAKIIPDAMALKPGEALPYRATLTGVVYSVDTPYDPNYGNVTVTMKVQGYKFQCYRMVGDGIDQIRESDTITVSGVIKNYNGKLEFDAKCTLDNWTKGPRTINYGPLVEDTAYRLYMEQNAIGKTLYFNGKYSGSRLSTSDKGSEGVDVFLERVSGKGVRFFFMDGETKTYIEVEDYYTDEGKLRGRAKVTTEPSVCWTYSPDHGLYLANVGAGKHFLGSYNTYETITASWVGYIEDANAGNVGKTQFVAKFMAASDVPEDGPSQGGTSGVMVTAPQAGVPYKWGIEQGTHSVNLYFTGTMSGYYGATSEDITKGVDVVLEAADGGYYVTFKDATGAKKYITVVISESNGKTYRNFTIADAPSQVYTYDTQYNTLVTEVNGDKVYFGTYDVHKTFSVSFFSKISSSFPAHFYTVGEGGEVEPEQPTEPAGPQETIPVATDTLKDGDKVVIYAPAYGKALSAEKVTAGSFYNKGVDVTIADGKLNGYGNTEIWTVVENADGIYSFAYNGQTIALGEQYSSMNLGEVYDEWELVSQDGTLYYIKNVGRGMYMEWYSSKDNWSAYSSPKTDEFEMSIYIIGKGLLGYATEEPEPTEPTAPDVTEPSTGVGIVTKPEVGVAYKWGIEQNNIDKTLYFNGAMAKTYYGGTTQSLDEAVDVYLEQANNGYYLAFKEASGAKKYINIVVKVDGTKTHRNFTIADKASTVYTWNAEYNTLQTDIEGTACYFGTYSTFDTFSVSALDKIGTSFPAHFYAEGQGTEPEPTVPSEPEVTQPAGATELKTGDQVVIYAPAYGKALSADKVSAGSFYNKGVDVTVSGGVVSGYGNAEIWTVSDNGNGTYSFANGGLNIGLGEEYSSLNLDAVYDEWELISLGGGLYHIKNVGRGNYLEWYDSKGNFSSYSKATDAQFEMSIYIIGKGILGEAGEEPEVTEPEATEPEATEPSTGSGYNKITSASQFTSGKYVMIVNTGYAPGVFDNGWLSAVQPTVSGNAVTNTAGAVWTLTVNGSSVVITDANGVAIAPKGGANNGVLEKSYDWEWTFENGTFVFAGTGADTVYLASNTSTTGQYPGNHRFRGYKTSTIEKYPAEYPYQFTLYQLGGEYVEPEVTEPEATEPTAPEATEPTGSAELKNGDQVVIYAPAYGKALSADKVSAGSFYNKGVDVTVSGGVVSGYGNAEIWTVSDNGNGTYSFANGGLNIGLGEEYSSLNLDAVYDEWELISLGGGLYHIKNVGRGNYLEWYDSKGNFSSYSKASDAQFEMSFYVIGEGIVGGEGNEPEATEPEATEPEASEPSDGGESVSVNFKEFPKGVQYEPETYDLGGGITLDIDHCHMNSQLRIYQDAKNGYDGKAIFSCANVLHSITLNTGYRAASMQVYGSEDGVNWELITVIEHPTKDGYADYTVVMPVGASYKYLMLDTVETQMRVTAMTFVFKK